MLARRLLTAAHGGGGFSPVVWTRGTLSAGGSPQTVLDDTKHNAFPGLAWLDPTRVLCVFRRGDSHLTNGDIYGIIGTVTGTWTFSWGAEFLIYSHATLDVRCEDGVTVIGDTVVVYGRLYNGSVNSAPFITICDDPADALTSGSTWGAPISVPLTDYTSENESQGRVLRLPNGTYLGPFAGIDSGPTFEVGVLLSSSLTDWSARTKVVIGTGANDYSEIDVTGMADGTLVAHMRSESANAHYTATSTDSGATWTAPTLAFTATGYPMVRAAASGILLTVYRSVSALDNSWRQSADDDVTWTTETVLDTTGYRSSYASALILDETHLLCVYAVEASGADPTASDIYSQIFTDNSTHS